MKPSATLLSALVGTGLCASVLAAPVRAIHQSDFLQAVGTPTVTVDFESSSYQSQAAILSGETLKGVYQGGPSTSLLGQIHYSIVGCTLDPCTMIVTDDYDTTSQTQYLGLNDPGNYNFFIGGIDTFSVTFSAGDGLSVFGMYLIATDPVGGLGAIMLDVASGGSTTTLLFGESVDRTLPDGGLAYFIGATGADQAITSINLRFADAVQGTFLYSIDDILMEQSLPEPGSVLLVLAALSGLRLSAKQHLTDSEA